MTKDYYNGTNSYNTTCTEGGQACWNRQLRAVKPVRAYFVKGSDSKMYNVTGLENNPTEAAKMKTGRKIKVGGKGATGEKGRRSWAVSGSVQVTAEAGLPPQAGGKKKLLRRGLLASGGLGTVTRSDINTLFIPLSFSGCPTTTAGTNYGAPAFTQAVRRGMNLLRICPPWASAWGVCAPACLPGP